MKNKPFVILVFIFFSVLTQRNEIYAQQEEIDSLKKEVRAVKEQILRLEMRLDSLASLIDTAKASKSVARNNSLHLYKESENWRKLKVGMSVAQVEKLLGAPTRITAGRYSKIWWYEWVDERYHNGHVSFDKNEKLILWVEP